MENANAANAKRTYDTFCKVLDSREWNYEKDDEALRIETGVRGDDLPIHLNISFDTDRALVRLFSPINFTIPEELIGECALALCLINDSLVDGNFDLNVNNGRLCFRMSTSFRESLLSAEALDYFLGFAISVVDEYNDKLLMLAKGVISARKFDE